MSIMKIKDHLKDIKTVALIQGGLGTEREISIQSAGAVAKAFDNLNVSYTIIESDRNLIKSLSALKPDRAFLAVHGKYAEDGTIQGICEYLKIPYTGSGVLTSALCMDKGFFKDYISRHRIPTPGYQNLNLENKQPQEVKIKLSLPLVIKPSREGSTLGVSICKKSQDLIPALKKALQYDKKVLAESYIEGMELAGSFLTGKALTPVEIVPEGGFYDYNSKYQSTETRYILPPGLDERTIRKCQDIVCQLVKLLHIRTYCRTDFIIKNNTDPLVIETNTLPGLTAHSLLPKSAQHDGIDFNMLVLKILKNARLDYIFNYRNSLTE